MLKGPLHTHQAIWGDRLQGCTCDPSQQGVRKQLARGRAAKEAFSAHGDQMIGIHAFQKLCSPIDPVLQLAAGEVAAAAGLIHELPSHDCRLVPAVVASGL